MSLYVNIEKQFGSFRLKVEFETGDETLALLGESGCGKSMTLRCIAGIIEPDQGQIVINDREVYNSEKKIHLSPRDRRVGYLFQNYALFPNMTVLDNVVAGMERDKEHNKKAKREIARTYLKTFHLDEVEDLYPYQISGGQQQRTALARILASKPDLLLLDEPFSALDATLRWEMEQVVRETMREFQGTSVLVTHDRDEVYRLSDMLAVYNQGRIDRFGEKWEIFGNPITMNTARLTGCKNLSPAYVSDGRIYAEDWDISFPCEREGQWTGIGIRAHRFQLADAPDAYAFPYEVTEKIEDTFSYIFKIKKAGSPEAKTLRWETDKEVGRMIPETGYVTLPKEEILYLKN